MRVLIYVFALCFCVNIYSQQNSDDGLNSMGMVSGKVVDVQKKVIVYARLIIKNSGDEIISRATTDKNGEFETGKFSITDGQLFLEQDLHLEVSYMGYLMKYQNIKIDSANFKLNLGDIVLEKDKNFLKKIINY